MQKYSIWRWAPICLALKKEKLAGELHLHSGQGFQYTLHGYFKLAQFHGIAPSMSKRGNCYDNAMAAFFQYPESQNASIAKSLKHFSRPTT